MYIFRNIIQGKRHGSEATGIMVRYTLIFMLWAICGKNRN